MKHVLALLLSVIILFSDLEVHFGDGSYGRHRALWMATGLFGNK